MEDKIELLFKAMLHCSVIHSCVECPYSGGKRRRDDETCIGSMHRDGIDALSEAFVNLRVEK